MRTFAIHLATTLFIAAVSISHSSAQSRVVALDKIITEMKLDAKGKFPYGFKPNTPRAKVEKAMAAHADVDTNDSVYVTYSVYLTDDMDDFGDISFDFPNGVLKSASVETYLGSWELSNKSFNSIKANFQNLYGPAEFREDTFYWKYKIKGRTLEIQLWEVDEEDDFGYGIDFLYY